MYVAGLHVPSELALHDWPFDIPAVRDVVKRGLQFTSPVTFLVGANGSGKSTLVEAMAEAYGIDVRGGHDGRRYASPLEKGPLRSALRLDLAPSARGQTGRRGKGFFLRAESTLGVFDFMSGLPGYGDDLDRVSHGESFLQVFAGRFASPGLYLLDEPESGLAFEALLQLLIVMHRVSTIGGQIVCATHSPVLTAFPGAEIIELSEQGMAVRKWSELDLVQDWKAFLSNPEAFVHRLLPEEHV